jgi:biopolymer transport protein ExbB
MAGLEVAAQGERESVSKEAVEDAGRHETARLFRYLGTLATVVGISPLLGLFGTVTGMINVFQTIAQTGCGQAAQLSGGISQALITTATGLLIAIPSLVAHNYFQEKAQVIVTDLERESLRVLRSLYLAPNGEASAPARPGLRSAVKE